MAYYTVKQVAEMSGVSVRMLHHYDTIGLLKPAAVGENGYRQYGRKELLRLQQILFHKTLGMTLNEVATILDDANFDAEEALRSHKNKLQQESETAQRLIKTIEKTLAALSGNATVKDADLYSGFEPEKQSEYEAWLIEKYGDDMQSRIAHSKQAFASLKPAERDAVMAELAEVEHTIAEGLRRGEPADSVTHDLMLDRHRAWVAFMWDKPCDHEAYAGLADLYLSHPDFEKRYEQIHPGFTAYLTDAMKAYSNRLA